MNVTLFVEPYAENAEIFQTITCLNIPYSICRQSFGIFNIFFISHFYLLDINQDVSEVQKST